MATHVLFVCTGNICRSAFAEEAARSLFDKSEFEFSSAGTHAISGARAADTMVKAAAELDVDVSSHSATPLHDCAQPDLVFGMEQHHLVAARRQFPDLDISRIRLLDHPSAISDPYGSDLDTYRGTTSHILSTLRDIDPKAFR
jgi:protein-tyrosine-phosphatase